jgi:hypothetical protein
MTIAPSRPAPTAAKFVRAYKFHADMKFPVARQISCRKEIVKSIQQLPPQFSHRYDKLRPETGNRQAEILNRSKI